MYMDQKHCVLQLYWIHQIDNYNWNIISLWIKDHERYKYQNHKYGYQM